MMMDDSDQGVISQQATSKSKLKRPQTHLVFVVYPEKLECLEPRNPEACNTRYTARLKMFVSDGSHW